MPGTSKAIKEQIISQGGIYAPPTEPGFIEDAMEVDIGEFRQDLENSKNMVPSFDLMIDPPVSTPTEKTSNKEKPMSNEKGRRDTFSID